MTSPSTTQIEADTRDWSKWTPNASGTLGPRGAVRPSMCPLRKSECDDCRQFMGHNANAPAFVGQAVSFCCNALIKDRS